VTTGEHIPAAEPDAHAPELDREQAHIMRAVRHASEGWAGAMRAHRLAPPDAGFPARLVALAEAADIEQIAWEHAHSAGLQWRPVVGAENAQPPYELRSGTGRRGPERLWTQFDAAVASLNRAIAGTDGAAVADAFGDTAQAARRLAEAVAAEDRAAQAAGETGDRASRVA
jgi:hypothetical protein